MSIKEILITAVVASVLILGSIFVCDKVKNTKTTEANAVEVVMLNGQIETLDKSEVFVENISPKEYKYTGPVYSNKGSYFDFNRLFGNSIVDAASNHKPATIGVEKIPGINLETMTLGDGGGVGKSTMGTDEMSIMDRLWTKVKDFALWIGIGLVALLIIPIIFPAAAPVVATILAKIKSGFTWLLTIIPGFGSFKAWVHAKEAEQAKVEVDKHVAMLQQVNDSLATIKTLVTPEVWTIVSTELQKKCDLDTQAAIGVIKP